MREKIIESIEKNKIIVIIRKVRKDLLLPLAEALYDGGIRLLEVTYCGDGTFSDEETAENIAMLANHLKEKMYVGAGTVLSEKQVALTKAAGGQFVISPNVNVSVIQKTRAEGLVSMPGAMTPTEIVAAKDAGADFVKIFPATNLGPAYIKAVRAPLSHIPLLAVGGINENNMKDYLAAGVSGFGIGANIVDKTYLEQHDFAEITALARKFTERIL